MIRNLKMSEAWRGGARRGKAGHGMARRGKEFILVLFKVIVAGRGLAWRGVAGRGGVRHGEARFIIIITNIGINPVAGRVLRHYTDI